MTTVAKRCSSPDLGLRGAKSPAPAKPFCGQVAGFSLHAGQSVEADDRAALERLCRYGLRVPFSQERLVLGKDGRVIYFLRRPPWAELLLRVLFVDALSCPTR